MATTGRPCTVCRGDHRDAIDARLKAGEPYTVVGYEFGVHPSSVRRHGRHHLFGVRRSAPLRRERGRLVRLIREIDLSLTENSGGR